jgi:hypothetical protein
MANRNRYIVEIPVVMKVIVGVWADSEEEAKDKAMYGEAFCINVTEDETEPKSDVDLYDWEWESYERVTSGNVYHGLAHSVDVYPDDDYEEDEDE